MSKSEGFNTKTSQTNYVTSKFLCALCVFAGPIFFASHPLSFSTNTGTEYKRSLPQLH